MELLVVLFLYKLYAHINIFKHIKEKYGQSEIKLARIIQKKHRINLSLACQKWLPEV